MRMMPLENGFIHKMKERQTHAYHSSDICIAIIIRGVGSASNKPQVRVTYHSESLCEEIAA